MKPGLRAVIITTLSLSAVVGCGTLHTGNRDVDRSFNSAQKATEKPTRCFLITGLAAAWGWFWFRNDGTIDYDPSAPEGEKVSLGFNKEDHVTDYERSPGNP